MSINYTELLKTLREKEASIDQRAADLATERKRVRAEIDGLSMAAQAAGQYIPPHLAGQQKQTQPDMAKVILREAGLSLHTTELAHRIQEKIGFPVKVRSLGTQLYRDSKRPDSEFVKDRKKNNTYGLKNWNK
jgi:hypothetical protein